MRRWVLSAGLCALLALPVWATARRRRPRRYGWRRSRVLRRRRRLCRAWLRRLRLPRPVGGYRAPSYSGAYRTPGYAGAYRAPYWNDATAATPTAIDIRILGVGAAMGMAGVALIPIGLGLGGYPYWGYGWGGGWWPGWGLGWGAGWDWGAWDNSFDYSSDSYAATTIKRTTIRRSLTSMRLRDYGDIRRTARLRTRS